MSRLPNYTHLTDAELLRECDDHYADGLIVELAKRLAELSDGHGELLSELEDKDTEIDRLKSEISDISDIEEERDELLSELEDKDTEIDRLKSEISDIEEERDEQRDEQRERADNAELEVKRLEEQIQELEEGSDELRALLQAADNQIFSLKGEVLDLKQAAQ